MILTAINRIIVAIQGKNTTEPITIAKAQIIEFTWLATGQVIQLFLAFISMKLMTSVGPAEYGKFILVSSVAGVFALLFFGPLEQGYIRFYFDYTENPHHRTQYLKSLTQILKLSNSVFILVAFLGLCTGIVFFKIDPIFFITASLMVIIGSSGSPIQGMMNALRLRKYSAIIQVGEKIIVIVSLIALLNLWKRNVDSIIISVVMGTGIGLLFRFIKYISQYNEVSASIENRMSDKYIFNEIRNRMARYCYPFVLWGGITWLQLFGERWIISFLLDSTQVGKYGFASTLLNSTVVLAATILAQFATPIVYKLYSSQNENSRKRGLKVIKILCWSTIILFSTFALIFFLYGAEIIALFSLSTFSIPTITLVTLCLGIGLFYVTQALTCIGLALHRPNIYLIPKLTTAGLSVIGYYFGCKYFGITGVAGVIVIVNSIYYFLVNRSNKILTRSSSGC